jgi:anthranilate phosphoribosyltransferase
VGLPLHSKDALRGGDPAANARALEDLLDGAAGAYRDTVLMNAGAGLLLAGVASTFQEGVARAAESIDTGKAKATLARLVEVAGG